MSGVCLPSSFEIFLTTRDFSTLVEMTNEGRFADTKVAAARGPFGMTEGEKSCLTARDSSYVRTAGNDRSELEESVIDSDQSMGNPGSLRAVTLTLVRRDGIP